MASAYSGAVEAWYDEGRCCPCEVTFFPASTAMWHCVLSSIHHDLLV